MNHGDFGYGSTEVPRVGFHGPYIFSMSGADVRYPSDFDISLLDDLGLEGYVKSSARGVVTGTAYGTPANFQRVVHWYNSKYQSWAETQSDGSFKSPPLPADTYTQALYQGQLLAATTTVKVKAGATATASITASNPIITQSRTTVFQIGDYDGSPASFVNADIQPQHHPSDKRMNWTSVPFTVGDNSKTFPMALF
ncbi:hypothetical protein PFICI_02982 [Pestalotiopsis fici W106-1]|uniref:Uncharacterized protein n=1 Tax=Pestalotiopsis fici (strain W106-1 / CGMCC3.15140) TaxID=1229662 RepID=W3XHN7_PESFW|nr:uncharacterized protein PFICI_02982 [Pestalotiopsis fici W106-1]ETS84957.1 hypothetical protein PFICI_02982 [Pestalotiopsis fici W106-1]